MARTKKVVLKKNELHLLLNPPTEQTWICPNHVGDKGVNFTIANSGTEKQCWLCCKPKPRRAKLLWPEYVIACEKVGIEPGTPGTLVNKLLAKKGEE